VTSGGWAALVVIALFASHVHATTHLVPQDYSTIQSAVDAAASGDTVLVAPGTYRGVGNKNIEFRGVDIVVTSSAGPEDTIIDCEFDGRGFYLHRGETRATLVRGFTIVNGNADNTAPGIPVGGGVYCTLASPTIADCSVLFCTAGYSGGGIGLLISDALIERCTLSGNYAGQLGGGLSFYSGDLLVRGCVIAANGASDGAGVAFTGAGSNRLVGCTVVANGSGEGAGGIRAYYPMWIERCIVWSNCSILGDAEIECPSAVLACTDVDSTGVSGSVTYGEDCLFVDPECCLPRECGQPGGDWSLNAASPCLPEHSPCGQLIGALGLGCGAPPVTGACCLPSTVCIIVDRSECTAQSGTYLGDGTDCEPNPCVPVAVERSSWGRIKARYVRTQ